MLFAVAQTVYKFMWIPFSRMTMYMELSNNEINKMRKTLLHLYVQNMI